MVPADWRFDLYFITKRRQFHLIIHNFPPCCIISLLPIGLAGVSSAFRGIRSQSVQQNPMHDVKLCTSAHWLAGAAWYEHHGWVSPNPVWEVSVMKVVDRRMTAVTAAPGGPTENEWETAFFGCPIVSGGSFCDWWLGLFVSMLLFWSHPLSFTNGTTNISANSALHWTLNGLFM